MSLIAMKIGKKRNYGALLSHVKYELCPEKMAAIIQLTLFGKYGRFYCHGFVMQLTLTRRTLQQKGLNS